uniref:Uncharacterized protein n=1 Tax=Timema cristinae TaxID=61476 RepID=A0A7R9CPH8_TIMCR|nr:unnamed protein product [Timema cristinae]
MVQGATLALDYTSDDGEIELANTLVVLSSTAEDGEIEILDDYYHFQHNGLSKRSSSPSLEHHENLLADKQPRVELSPDKCLVVREYVKRCLVRTLLVLSDRVWARIDL